MSLTREITTSAIVLGHSPDREYDRLVKLFTSSFGKIRATAKSAQKPTSPFVGRLDSMNVCKLNLYRSAKGKFTVRQCVLLKTFEDIKKNVALFAAASGVIEIADKLTLEKSNMKKYFMLICKTLDMISKNKKPYFIYLIFKIKFLRMFGLIPSFKHCMACHRKIQLNDIAVWNAENLICSACLENNNKKIAGNVFDANMLKLINFIAENEYEKNIKITVDSEDMNFLENFLGEIWNNQNLPEIKSEKIIKQFL